LDAFRRKFI